MPIPVTCNCGRTLCIKDDLAGRRVRCPSCQAILTVPKPEPEPEIEIQAEEETAYSVLNEDEARRRRTQSRTDAHEDEDEDGAERRRRQRRRQDEEEREEEEREQRRRKRERSEEIRRRAQLEKPRPTEGGSRSFGTSNAGVVGGLVMILIAVVWFVLGLRAGIIFFYPPILVVVGLVAIFKGLASR